MGIRSLVEKPTVARDFSSSSSTPHAECRDASPQAISERTSYCRTRLEFLPYTQVIPSCCTASGCGPPRDFTRASPCSSVARPASGLVHATLPPKWERPYQARFHCVSGVFTPLDMPRRTNSLDRAAKSTPSPVTCATGSDSLLACGFRSISPPFRDTFHLSLTVLVRYRSRTIFSLGS